MTRLRLLHRFGINTADFIICSQCESYMGAIMPAPPEAAGGDDDMGAGGAGGGLSVLNVGHLLDRSIAVPEPPAVSFDGEGLPQRLARWSSGWTPTSVTATK